MHATKLSALKILGMDANSTPTIHPERLEIALHCGFQRVDHKDVVSAYNPTLESRAAKIDFIFASTQKSRKLAEVNEQPLLDIPIEDPAKNPSDHRPIVARFELHPPTPSKIVQLIASLGRKKQKLSNSPPK